MKDRVQGEGGQRRGPPGARKDLIKPYRIYMHKRRRTFYTLAPMPGPWAITQGAPGALPRTDEALGSLEGSSRRAVP
jgi:hypothetical protein